MVKSACSSVTPCIVERWRWRRSVWALLLSPAGALPALLEAQLAAAIHPEFLPGSACISSATCIGLTRAATLLLETARTAGVSAADIDASEIVWVEDTIEEDLFDKPRVRLGGGRLYPLEDGGLPERERVKIPNKSAYGLPSIPTPVALEAAKQSIHDVVPIGETTQRAARGRLQRFVWDAVGPLRGSCLLVVGVDKASLHRRWAHRIPPSGRRAPSGCGAVSSRGSNGRRLVTQRPPIVTIWLRPHRLRLVRPRS